MVVHNETSTGVVSPIAEIRRAIDRAGHPALYLVDTVSSLGSMEFRHDDWGADVTVCGSQKGMMMPPGIGFNAIGEKAIRASETASMTKAYWDWAPILKNNEQGFFPYTPSTNLLYGLCESLTMLMEEGLDHVFAGCDGYRIGEFPPPLARAVPRAVFALFPIYLNIVDIPGRGVCVAYGLGKTAVESGAREGSYICCSEVHPPRYAP